jgi:hypothetical protein
MSIRPIPTGAHEVAALALASHYTRHVSPIFAVARISRSLDTSPPAVDDPWAPDLFALKSPSAESEQSTPRSRHGSPSRHVWSPPHLDSMSISLKPSWNIQEPSFIRQMKDSLHPDGLGTGRLGGAVRVHRRFPAVFRGAGAALLRALICPRVRRISASASGFGVQADDLGATHVAIIQRRGTPMYGSEFEDSNLASQVRPPNSLLYAVMLIRTGKNQIASLRVSNDCIKCPLFAREQMPGVHCKTISLICCQDCAMALSTAVGGWSTPAGLRLALAKKKSRFAVQLLPAA